MSNLTATVSSFPPLAGIIKDLYISEEDSLSGLFYESSKYIVRIVVLPYTWNNLYKTYLKVLAPHYSQLFVIVGRPRIRDLHNFRATCL